ncbi:MAG: hypothetical protein AAF135_07460 [Bacteroidota bacterium]
MKKHLKRHTFHWPKGLSWFYVWLFCSLIYVALCGVSSQEGHDWGGDFAAYIMQGQAIAQGSWEILREQVVFRHDHSIPIDSPEYYPWGFPLILSPFLGGSAIPWSGLKWLMVAWYVGTLGIFLKWAHDYLSDLSLVVLGMIWGLHPFMIDFSHQIISDYPFLFFSMLSLYEMHRSLQEKGSNYLRMGIWVGLAILIRTQAWTLLPVLLLRLFWINEQGRWQLRPVFLPNRLLALLGLGGLWGLSGYLFPQGRSYWSFFPETSPWVVFQDMSVYYLKVTYKFFESWPSDHLFAIACQALLVVGIMVMAIRGLWLKRHRLSLGFIYSILTGGLLLLYPYKQGPRFIFTILMMCTLWMMVGGIRSWEKWILVLVAIVWISGSLWMNIQTSLKTDCIQGPLTEESEAMWEFIEQELPKEATYVFYKPRVLTLMTGKKAVFATTPNYEAVVGDYLITSQDSLQNFSPEAMAYVRQLEVVYVSPNWKIWEK